MKNLKSIFFLFSLTFLFFTYSCSKENSNSPFDLEEGTATVEIGEDLFFSDDVRARFITTHLFAIYMHTNSNGALNESIRIEFYIPDELALENQTYHHEGLECLWDNFENICGKIIYYAENPSDSTDPFNYASVNDEANCTFTFFDIGTDADDNVIGTFSGELVHFETGNKQTLTNGKFNLKAE